MENVLKKFVEWLWEIISWLQEHLVSDRLREALLDDLGLDSNTPAPSVDPADLASIQAYLASDNPDVLAFLEVAGALVNVMDAFESFLEPLTGGAGASGREILFWLIQLASLDLLRDELPCVYRIAQAAGFIDEKVAAHELPSFDFSHFWGPMQTEADAKRSGDFMFLLALAAFVVLEWLKHVEVIDSYYYPEVLIGWDALDGDATLADSISGRMVTIMLRVPGTVSSPPFNTILTDDLNRGLTVTMAWVPKDHGGGHQGLFLSLGGTMNFEINNPASLLRVEANFPDAASCFLLSGNRDASVGINGRGEIEYRRRRAFAEENRPADEDNPTPRNVDLIRPAFAFPNAEGSRLEVGNFGFAMAFAQDEAIARISLFQAALVIGGKDSDSFLASVFPAGGLRADFDLDIGYDFVAGEFFFGASPRFTVIIPIGKALGPLTIFHITIALGTLDDGDGPLVLTTSLSFSLKLFAITAVVDQIGYRASVRAGETGGSLGPVDEPDFGFMPPKGIGLTVNGGRVKGGGFIFFDPEKNEYAGMIDITVCRFTLKVTVLITTNLPTDPDYSLLIIGSIEGLRWSIFAGGLITGIGVVFAMHRTMSVKAFQDGIKNRTVDAILFPEDPVANAPRLLQALKTLFPVAPDQWIVGLSVQAAWLNKRMVKIELGILIEFESPTRIVLLGQVALGLPTQEKALVVVNFDVIGIIDFSGKYLSVDSELYDSRIGPYPLTGGLAVRARWGEKKDGAGALGGLHPRFPLPDGFPKLDRLAVTIGQGNNPRIRGEAYVGLTANTFQFGIKAELYVAAGGFSLEGYVSFDLLFQFDPFRFLAELDFNVSVRYKGRTLAGLRLVGLLAGPAPWHASGKVRIKLLFIKVTKHFDRKWGDDSKELPEPVDIWGPLENALRSSDNWTGQLPPARRVLVTLRSTTPAGELFIHPLGQIEMVQRVVPLGIDLDKFQNSSIAGDRRFDITDVKINGVAATTSAVKEHFAPGQFFDIEGDEAITRPSFEEFLAGLRFGSDNMTLGGAVPTKFEYEEIVINEKISRPSYRDTYQIDSAVMVAAAEYGTVAKAINAIQGKYQGPRHQIGRSKLGYAAVSVDGLVAQPLDESLPDDASYTEVKQALERHLAAHPDERRNIQIVRQHEVQGV